MSDCDRILRLLEERGERGVTSYEISSGVASKVRGRTKKVAPRVTSTGAVDTGGVAPMSSSTVEPGYCECGCGEWVGFYRSTNRRRGAVKGQPKRLVKGHYMRIGAPSTEERFWSKVDRRGPDDCWEWQGSRFADSEYGQFKVRNPSKNWRAHRLAYILAHGEIPDGLYVCHACDNPPCCNPSHLWLGTPADNQRDCIEKGRKVTTPGEKHGYRKLSARQVAEIRSLAGTMSNGDIAAKYGVSKNHVGRIIRRELWRSQP